MKNRTNEIKFKEDYTEKDWNSDWPTFDVLLWLVPPEEKKYVEDMIIMTANNKAFNDKDRQKMIATIFMPYTIPEVMMKMPKWKMIKLAVVLKKEKLKDALRR